jgi:hypothetical protein
MSIQDVTDDMTIERRHQKGDAASRAVYSPCDRYRYLLWRDWGQGGRRLGFVMLNPSTATEAQNDPTVERCERRARTLGFDGFGVANIFAFRATDPRVMRAEADPVGPANDAFITELALGTELLICGWGTHGAHRGRGVQVEAFLRAQGRALFHLGLTLGGAPKHPLYIAYSQWPAGWLP